MVRNFIIGNITVFNSENKWCVGESRYNFPINDNANPRYIILDGQQRTTTLYSLRIGQQLKGIYFSNFKNKYIYIGILTGIETMIKPFFIVFFFIINGRITIYF